MKRNSSEIEAAAFARRTEKAEAQRRMLIRHASHRAMVEAQAEWDADHPRKNDLDLDVVAAELGIDLVIR